MTHPAGPAGLSATGTTTLRALVRSENRQAIAYYCAYCACGFVEAHGAVDVGRRTEGPTVLTRPAGAP